MGAITLRTDTDSGVRIITLSTATRKFVTVSRRIGRRGQGAEEGEYLEVFNRRATQPSTSKTSEMGANLRGAVLSRPEQYNTITPELREDLEAAIDQANSDREVRVLLLRAEGSAFCAGYGLDWAASAQANEESRERTRRIPGVLHSWR